MFAYTGGVHDPLQGTLLGSLEPAVDPGFAGLERVVLDDTAWVDVVRGWVRGADNLFAELVEQVAWSARRVRLYDTVVDEPRLTAVLRDDRPVVVEDMRRLLGARYGIEFGSVGANFYRDGRDSVAWHGDRVARDLPEAVVAVVTLGGPRRFLLRPLGGGRSVRFEPRSGDLLVMGGSCQRTWQHSVPKVGRAQPRVSLTFRHAYR